MRFEKLIVTLRATWRFSPQDWKQGRRKNPRMRMSGLRSGNQAVASVTRWNQKYLSSRMCLDFILAGSKWSPHPVPAGSTLRLKAQCKSRARTLFRQAPSRARTLFLWNARRSPLRISFEVFTHYADESLEGVRAGGGESVPDQCPPKFAI